jgi:hypothetical protein
MLVVSTAFNIIGSLKLFTQAFQNKTKKSLFAIDNKPLP